jgi:hypothetical protein
MPPETHANPGAYTANPAAAARDILLRPAQTGNKRDARVALSTRHVLYLAAAGGRPRAKWIGGRLTSPSSSFTLSAKGITHGD